MLIGVVLGTTMKVMFPMFPKPAIAFPPACVAVAPSAMEAAVAPPPSDVLFADTVARILACDKWDWRGILGVDRNDAKPNVASAYRKRSLLIHPDKRTVRGIELAGGNANCDLAFQMVQQANELGTQVPATIAAEPCLPKPSPSSPNQCWQKAAPTTPTKYGPPIYKAPPPTAEAGAPVPTTPPSYGSAPTTPPRYGPTPTKSGPSQPPRSPPGVYVHQGYNEPSSSGLHGSTAEAGTMYKAPPTPTSSTPHVTKAPPPTLSEEDKELLRHQWAFRTNQGNKPQSPRHRLLRSPMQKESSYGGSTSGKEKVVTPFGHLHLCHEQKTSFRRHKP